MHDVISICDVRLECCYNMDSGTCFCAGCYQTSVDNVVSYEIRNFLRLLQCIQNDKKMGEPF